MEVTITACWGTLRVCLTFFSNCSLQQRKKLLQQQKLMEAQLPDPSVPDGHIVMSSEDRMNTLEVLQKSKSGLLIGM